LGRIRVELIKWSTDIITKINIAESIITQKSKDRISKKIIIKFLTLQRISLEATV
jgi:hypothetical protein